MDGIELQKSGHRFATLLSILKPAKSVTAVDYCPIGLKAFLLKARARVGVNKIALHHAKYRTLLKSILDAIILSPLELLPLPRLTPVSSSPLFLLVSAHACSQRDVNAWRRGKAETLGHLHQVELVHIKDRPETMRGVCLQLIGLLAILN